MLPVTDDGHNNTKQSTSNSTTEKKNDHKEDDTWENDENTTKHENEQKEDETGENWWWCSPWQCLSLNITLTCFSGFIVCYCSFCMCSWHSFGWFKVYFKHPIWSWLQKCNPHFVQFGPLFIVQFWPNLFYRVQ